MIIVHSFIFFILKEITFSCILPHLSLIYFHRRRRMQLLLWGGFNYTRWPQRSDDGILWPWRLVFRILLFISAVFVAFSVNEPSMRHWLMLLFGQLLLWTSTLLPSLLLHTNKFLRLFLLFFRYFLYACPAWNIIVPSSITIVTA